MGVLPLRGLCLFDLLSLARDDQLQVQVERIYDREQLPTLAREVKVVAAVVAGADRIEAEAQTLRHRLDDLCGLLGQDDEQLVSRERRHDVGPNSGMRRPLRS